MLNIENLEFTLESKWTGRLLKTPCLTVSKNNASLNKATCNMLNTNKELYYQIAISGDKSYLILGYVQFANQSYKASYTKTEGTSIVGITLNAKDIVNKYGPKEAEDKVRYDLNPVPINGKDLLAFELVRVITDSIITVEH